MVADELLDDFLGSSIFSGGYFAYHVLSPVRTLANWPAAESQGFDDLAFILGLVGLVSYVALIRMGRRRNEDVRAAY